MKRSLLLPILLSLSLYGDDTIYSTSPSPYYKNTTQGEKKGEVLVEREKSSQISEKRGVMFIDPKGRSQDLVSAFNYLKKSSPSSKFEMVLFDGSTIKDISDLEIMPHGTLIIAKITTLKGTQLKIIKVEQVDSFKSK